MVPPASPTETSVENLGDLPETGFILKDRHRVGSLYFAEAPTFLPDHETTIMLPKRQTRGSVLGWLIFLIAIAAGSLGSFYLLSYVSPRYVTEAHFSVRETAMGSASAAVGQTGPAPSVGIGIAAAGGSAFIDTFMVSEYLRSPSIVYDLKDDIDLRALFDKTGIDSLSRFDRTASAEALVSYFRKRVSVAFDPITATASFTVEAFTPQETFDLAQKILKRVRDAVNEMHHGVILAMVGYAQQEVDDAAKGLQVLRLAKVQDTPMPPLTGTAPAPNPDRSSTQTGTAKSLGVEGDGFLRSRQLEIELQFAEQSYANALVDFQVAQQTAARSQRYLLVFVPPVFPTAPTRPVLWSSLLSLWFACLTAAGIVGLLIAAIRERLS